MITVELTQGTQEWIDFRGEHFTASDAPAAAGVSKYKTRSELLREAFTGHSEDVSEYQQAIFDDGHAAEAEARPIADEVAGEELFPATGESSDNPIFSASFDGITMCESIIWEHKLINEELRTATADTLHEMYKVQMDHQLMVSGAEKCLFMASDGTKENCNWFWYERDEKRIQSVIAIWKQFQEDLANYKPEEVAPTAQGNTPDTLPALTVQLKGMVTQSNLDEFKSAALSVFGGINRELQTDQDFADAEKTVKWCKSVEEKLALTKTQALEQTADIDQLFRTIDEVSEEARQTRLQLDKLVKDRKQAIRAEIRTEAENDAIKHVAQINEGLGGKIKITAVRADFAGAMKGKKTVSSLRDAVNTELANFKIAVNDQSDTIRANLEILRSESKGYESLFCDAQQLVLKAPDDLKNLITARISEHKAEEDKRLESEREKIRIEEREKAKAGDLTDEPLKPETDKTTGAIRPSSIKRANTRPTPSGQQMVTVLRLHYDASEAEVIRWLSEFIEIRNSKSA